MANYQCAVRSNYFHVKDEKEFRNFMSKVCGCEEDVELFERKDNFGNIVFGFGCYGGIHGLDNTDDDPYAAFIEEIKKHITDDDAAIIFEVGHEKLRYLTGLAIVITSKHTDYVDIEDLAVNSARELLGNPKWETECCY